MRNEYTGNWGIWDEKKTQAIFNHATFILILIGSIEVDPNQTNPMISQRSGMFKHVWFFFFFFLKTKTQKNTKFKKIKIGFSVH